MRGELVHGSEDRVQDTISLGKATSYRGVDGGARGGRVEVILMRELDWL